MTGFSAHPAHVRLDVHTPDERIALASLEAMFDVTLGLVDAARRV